MKMKRSSGQISRRFGKARAFSLIEVTMALGITAMVLVPLLALLPHSMKNMREAIDVSISSRIMEEIASEAQLMEFEDLDRLEMTNNGERYYDIGGNEITTGKSGIVYTARIDVPSAVGGVGGVQLPSSSLLTSKYARRVVVDVAVTRGLPFDFDDPDNYRDMQSLVTIVSKLRDDLDSADE